MKCPTHFFFLTVVLTHTVIAQAQVYVVHTDTVQYFEHPTDLKFLEALESDEITYTQLGQGDVQFTIDLENRELVMIPETGPKNFTFEITEIFDAPEGIVTSFECKDGSGFLGVIALYENEDGGYNMLVEYKTSDAVTEGYMCFDVTVDEELFSSQ